MSSTSNKIDVELDATGLMCPMPVLRARRFLDEMNVGEILQVTASDPAAVHDMPAFCRMAGHKLLMAYVTDENYIFEIEKCPQTEA